MLLSVVEGLAISFPEIFVGERLCSDTMLLSVVEGLAISVSEIFVGERLCSDTMQLSVVEGWLSQLPKYSWESVSAPLPCW
jgi:energy-converting hydrogenase Eha subunit B